MPFVSSWIPAPLGLCRHQHTSVIGAYMKVESHLNGGAHKLQRDGLTCQRYPGVTYVGRQQQNTIFYFARPLRLPAGDEHSEWGEKTETPAALSPPMRCSLGCMAYIAGSSEDRQQTGHLSYSSLPLPPRPPFTRHSDATE